MEKVFELFSRSHRLPAAFTLHTDAGSRQVGEGESLFEVRVCNRRGARALLSTDELAIAEAYVRGDLEFEGDLIRLMWFRSLLTDSRWWLKLWRRLQPMLVGRQRLNPAWIAKHYDAQNLQLFATDRDYRAYTPGIYHADADTMEESTRRKYEFAWEWLRLRPGLTVLDVGHGWGGFMQYCAERGVRVEGITLSRHQLEFVQRLIAERRWDAAATYQDFFTYQPSKRFDAVSMMGVIEDLSDYPSVMARLAELVAPGGRVYLDFAAGKVPFGTSSFVTKHVWPGTFRMVYMPELMAAIDRSALELVGVWDDRRNYHLWARNGHQRWVENRAEVVRRSNEETWRLFRLLFAGTAGRMNDPSYRSSAYRMVLELPAERLG